MRKIAIIKNGNGIEQFRKLNGDWQNNSIELMWDINELRKHYSIVLISITSKLKDECVFENRISLYDISIYKKNKIHYILRNLIYGFKVLRILNKEKINFLIISNFKFLNLFLLSSEILKYKVIPNFSRANQVSDSNFRLIRKYQISDVIIPGFMFKSVFDSKGLRVHMRLPRYPDSFYRDIICSDLPNYPFIISFIGRLIISKGVYEFIFAAIELAKDNYNIGFVVIGEGPEEENINRIITENSCNRQICLLGYKNNIEIGSYLRKSNILVFPSYTEGFSKVWIEAIYTETPIILTKLSGIENLIKDRIHGLYILSGSHRDIVDKILQLYKDPVWYQKVKINLKMLRNDPIFAKSRNFYENVIEIIENRSTE